jgi:hypothetical protein
VWLFTDENGDDKADKKEVIFQGIEGEQHDHGMHAFTFGPTASSTSTSATPANR